MSSRELGGVEINGPCMDFCALMCSRDLHPLFIVLLE